jgi:hypothetical protein
VPLAPAETDCVFLAIDNFVALPADAHTVDPSPAVETYNPRFWSYGITRWLVFFPTDRAIVGISWRVT